MKSTITFILAFFFCFPSCEAQDNGNHGGLTVGKTITSVRYDGLYYFPLAIKGAADSSSGIDSFEQEWYGWQLHAMNEPILYNDNSGKEIYRFTWLRSFHNPVAVRMERSDTNYTLYWKKCDGAGGYEPGELVTDNHKSIGRAEWNEFLHLVQKTGFWDMSCQNRQGGCDGASWILEGKTHGRYHVTDRWSPTTRFPEYSQCCQYLLRLTELKIKRRELY